MMRYATAFSVLAVATLGAAAAFLSWPTVPQPTAPAEAVAHLSATTTPSLDVVDAPAVVAEAAAVNPSAPQPRRAYAPEVVEAAREFVDRHAQYYMISSKETVAPKLVAQLNEMGIRVDANDEELMGKIRAAVEVGAREHFAWSQVARARLDKIVARLESAGQYEVLDPKKNNPPASSHDRPCTIRSQPMPDGTLHRYVITSKDDPEYFAENESRRREIAEAMLCDAIAAVREARVE